MRRPTVARPLTILTALLAVWLLLPCLAFADTIILKNGHRIVALSVVEEGDKVRYLTSAGELTLPKAIVDHIEKGGFVSSAGQAGKDLAIAAPELSENKAGAKVESLAVHDGVIDGNYIAELEREAQSGTRDATEKAAFAHHAVAQFELSRGDSDRALEEERRALSYGPEQIDILLNIAYVHLRRSEYSKSLEYLDQARRVEPKNADVAKLSGWAYYRMNKLDEAIAEWRRALALRPEAGVQAALDKVLQDRNVEASYQKNESSHFAMRSDNGVEPGLAREVLRTLEGHFLAIESELDFEPSDPVGVILYPKQAFMDITRAPSWAGALNDGRIRVPVQGLTEVTPELSRVLKHELTHSFVQQKTHARAPTWVQEGLAQWMEGKRSGDRAAALVEIYQAKRADPLGMLEGSWSQMPADAAEYAYAWALANVEYIVQVSGMRDMERVLDLIGSGVSTEEALRQVLHCDYGELMHATADYLQKTYGQ